MDFFEHQANARRQTGRLLVYFLAAVGLTLLALNVGMLLLSRLTGASLAGSWLWHDWSLQVMVGTLFIIAGGSLREYLILRGGGQALAASMGARRLDFATTVPAERQFINVVAEMSIASGVPAPTLYVMDREHGINAFVAGLSVDQTVMVVTAGALEAFDRDELQAVVGHEFSHILNGDMRLNVRLLALLAGILAIGQCGGFLMRLASDSGASSRRDRKGGIFQVFLLGLLLWLIGYIGLFFGRLIKAAISRQREFLADASSVQFTRNSAGLAEALLKIRNHAELSWLAGLYAETMSHMCFAETLSFSSWFATHPPIDARIAMLGKHFLVRDRARQREQLRQVQTAGEVAAVQGLAATPAASGELAAIPYLPGGGEALATVAAALAPAVMSSAALVARTGTVNPAELASAQMLFRRLPPGVQQALESCEGAQALLYALTARHNAAPLAVLLPFFQEHEPALQSRVEMLYRILEGLDLAFALPLTELALPRLQLMEPDALRSFMGRLQQLAQLDQRLSTFEFALLMLLRKQLQLLPRARPVKMAQCLPAAAVVVAVMLRTGGMEGERLERTFQRLMRTVGSPAAALPDEGTTRLSRLGRHLHLLGGLSLQDKKNLLELAATAVLADAEVRLEEYELLRVVAALLDCPMPVLEA
ncbi:MAG: protease [Moraxellaceae bacterium]|jgi:Zn-dependent protease with chaperone function|nr:protease [Moraxellaceae bacterium]